jgi:type IV pilus assembly protein PilV
MRLGYKNQKGSTFIEAMVAVGIFLVGVLSIMQLNTVVLKQTAAAKYRADASFLAQEMVGRIWADQLNTASYTNTAYAPRVAMATKIQNMLPSGTLNIAIVAGATSTAATVTVGWTQPGEPAHQVLATTTVAP